MYCVFLRTMTPGRLAVFGQILTSKESNKILTVKKCHKGQVTVFYDYFGLGQPLGSGRNAAKWLKTLRAESRRH